MDVTYHPLVQRDVVEILRYYRRITPRLADEFRDELREMINRVAENPQRFHPVGNGFHRANLRRFPYHVIYELKPDTLRVMVVRHNKRRPQFGMERE
jgi:toxin ParE1/3/4